MNDSRTALRIVSALALAACAVPTVEAQQPAPPNILFVMIDDLGWMDLHVQGNEQFVTPNLDRLAAQGTRFTDFYAAAPVCSPTRAACITGLAPARVEVTNHIPDRWSFYDAEAAPGAEPAQRAGRKWGPGKSLDVLDKQHRTIAQRLQAAGYHTGFIGKWHLAGPDWARPIRPCSRRASVSMSMSPATRWVDRARSMRRSRCRTTTRAWPASTCPTCWRRKQSTSSDRPARARSRSSCVCGPTRCTIRSRRRRSCMRTTPTVATPMVRSRIHHWDNDDHELFDLESDLGERHKLYGQEPEKAAELEKKLMKWLAATGAELPRLYRDIPASELPGKKRSE